MSKRNLYGVKEEEERPLEKVVEKIVVEKSSKSSSIAVQSMIDAKINVTGYVTGNSYIFNGAGSVVNVDERDVENLLEKRQGGRQCCGGTGNGNAMFSLVEVN